MTVRLNTENLLVELRGLYGNNVTTADLRAYCAMNGVSYPTVTKKLEEYKDGRGKWNLTVQEKLEQNYNAPSALPAVEQNLIRKFHKGFQFHCFDQRSGREELRSG